MSTKCVAIVPSDSLMLDLNLWDTNETFAVLSLNLETGVLHVVPWNLVTDDYPKSSGNELIITVYNSNRIDFTPTALLEYARQKAVSAGYDAIIGDFENPYEGYDQLHVSMITGGEFYPYNCSFSVDENGNARCCQRCPHFKNCESLGEHTLPFSFPLLP